MAKPTPVCVMRGYTPYEMSSDMQRIHRALDRADGGDLACDEAAKRTDKGGAGKGEKGEGSTRAAATALKPFGPNWLIAENQPCQTLFPGLTLKETYTYTWSGDCVDGKVSGEGRGVWHLPDRGEYIYEGSMRDGKRHGGGTWTFPDGSRYEGEYRDNKMNGGTQTWADGDRYEGEWRDSKPHGYGTHTTAAGSRYEGEWCNGCYGTRDGKWVAVNNTAEACGFE